MMLRHFARSSAKLSDAVSASRSSARAESMTNPADGDALHPFCGAEMSTSTPSASISIHALPEAMQSSTSKAPTSWAASASWVG